MQLTAEALAFFLIGLAAHSLIAVLARAFYAGKDTITPVIAAVIAVVVNVGLGIVLVGPVGLGGLSLAIAIAAWIECAFLVAVLRRRHPAFDVRAIGEAFVRSGVAAAGAGAAAFAVFGLVEPAVAGAPDKVADLVLLVAASAAGGAVFVAISAALRIPELRTIVSVMADLVRRPSPSMRP